MAASAPVEPTLAELEARHEAGPPGSDLPFAFHHRFQVLDDSRPYAGGRAVDNGEWFPTDLPVEVLHKATGIVMRLIPAGTFVMGTPEGKGPDHERPLHKVTLSTPFYCGKFEVTWKQWYEYDDGTWIIFEAKRPEWSGRPSMPVVNVTAGWCHYWLEHVGAGLRLPTEAEYEFAARAGVATVYPWGDEYDQAAADALGAKSWLDLDDGDVKVVGSFSPNGFGLFDLHGNVWEWLADGYDAQAYTSRASGVSDPTVPGRESMCRGVGVRLGARGATGRPASLTGFRAVADVPTAGG